MKHPAPVLPLLVAVILWGLIPSPARAEPTITWIDGMYVSDLSADGSVATGNSNDGTYSPCRWTETGGVVRLGRSSGEILGRGGGIPGISADGERISSSIASFDSTHVTQGRWTKGLGWEQVMPPLPPGGAIVDESAGSAWGISGDGSTVVGYAWHAPARAYATAWNDLTGMTVLGGQSPDYDSRANDADDDGNVVVGWSSVGYGYWQPTVWEDGAITVLHASERWCEAKAVNPAGDTVVGSALDTLTGINAAAMWVKDGAGWNEYILGALPGTFGNGVGNVYCLGLSADGSRVVGINGKDNWTSVGFVWDPEQGIVDAKDWLAGRGAILPDSLVVSEMSAISDDGRTMAGLAYDPFVYPPKHRAFLVTLEEVSNVPSPIEAAFRLGPATPNPFNPATTFVLTLPQGGKVTVDILDVRGRLVQTIHDGILPAGAHLLKWNGMTKDGRMASSGTYLARARDDRGVLRTRRMMLVK